MATISSPGLGSGLDVKSIVSQLVALERKPIETLQTQKETLQAKLSAFGLIQSYTTNLLDAANVLTKADTWRPTKASSPDASSVAVTSTTSAVPGSYAVEVTQLAQSQSLASGVYTSNMATTGSGTLRIELGGWDAGRTTFTPKTGATAVDVVIAPGQDTLEAVRSAINAANAGVSASIVRDASGTRLAIRSINSGLENSVRITATADAPTTPGGPTLAGLVYDPPNAVPGALAETLAARNATGTVNGLAISSNSNVLSDVVQGLTITFNKVTTTPVQLSVQTDNTAMRKSLEDFVKAYNDINKYIRDQTKYDDESKKASTLQGDRATLALQSQLRAMLGSSSNASARYGRLSDVGVELQPDGNLKVNETRFTQASSSANLAELSRAFTADGPRDVEDGFAVRIKTLATQLNGSGGVVETRTNGLLASIKRNDERQKREETRVAQVEARLNRQYSALDTKLATLNGLNTYISQQITSWNKGNS
ncbi:MAG TPA: flagellar filament capping protein FliD [Methylibium sp.]|uniref:flagellar filament capping protein FliD n=1 Tax=Methylibium sp. TaxID=2067992 RepID=UPI002DB641B3|nr:flagellar filament capping protein FliD [Methylibium sp.]HEU4457635.1 flagellar filament capping protein FliD [Methylibium sp.]